MSTLKTLAFALAAVLSMGACTNSYYTTTCNPAPLLREANEVTISAGRSTYNYSRSNDLSLAYSPLDKLGLFANMSWIQSSRGLYSQESYGMSASFYEGAIGYYNSWDEYFGYDIYLGFGQTQNAECYAFDFYNNAGNGYKISFDYTRIFLQPAISYTSDFFDLQFALRASQLAYSEIQIDSLAQGNIIDPPPHNGDQFFLVEPGLSFRGGYRYLKLLLHLGYSFNLSNQPLFRDYSNISIGLVYNFKPSYRHKPRSLPDWF